MNWPYPGQDIAIPDARYNQTVYVFRCERSTVRVSGKCKSIILDGCEKTAVVFDDVATTCEFVNCRSVQMQVCDKEFLWKALFSKILAIFVQQQRSLVKSKGWRNPRKKPIWWNTLELYQYETIELYQYESLRCLAKSPPYRSTRPTAARCTWAEAPWAQKS